MRAKKKTCLQRVLVKCCLWSTCIYTCNNSLVLVWANRVSKADPTNEAQCAKWGLSCTLSLIDLAVLSHQVLPTHAICWIHWDKSVRAPSAQSKCIHLSSRKILMSLSLRESKHAWQVCQGNTETITLHFNCRQHMQHSYPLHRKANKPPSTSFTFSVFDKTEVECDAIFAADSRADVIKWWLWIYVMVKVLSH